MFGVKETMIMNLIFAMTLQLYLFLCFSSYFWGLGKAGKPNEDGSMNLAEARNVMSEYNSELVRWIDFAIYSFIAYVSLNFLYILILSIAGKNVLGSIKLI